MQMWQALPVLVLLLVPFRAFAADMPLDPESAKNLKVQNVALQGDAVSGEVVNTTHHPVRDVLIQITYVWYWKDERHPGMDNPGRTDVYTMPGDLPAGATKSFTYRPATPLPQRSDGHFGASAYVVGFTEIVP